MSKKLCMITVTVLTAALLLFITMQDVCYGEMTKQDALLALFEFDLPETPEFGLAIFEGSKMHQEKLDELIRRTKLINEDYASLFNDALFNATKERLSERKPTSFYLVQINTLFTDGKFNDAEMQEIIKRLNQLTPENVESWMKDKKDIEGINHAAVLMAIKERAPDNKSYLYALILLPVAIAFIVLLWYKKTRIKKGELKDESSN